MADIKEQSWELGNRQAWRAMLSECVKHLGEEGRDKASWMLERQDVVIALRSLCAEFGDNDWDENLHLGDVIEKHLANHLRS